MAFLVVKNNENRRQTAVLTHTCLDTDHVRTASFGIGAVTGVPAQRFDNLYIIFVWYAV